MPADEVFQYTNLQDDIFEVTIHWEEESDNCKQYIEAKNLNTRQRYPLQLSPYCEDPNQAAKDYLDLGLFTCDRTKGNRPEGDLARWAGIIRSLLNLYCLVQHETDLPQSAANGVGDENQIGAMDEGVVRAGEIIEQARQALLHEGIDV